MSATLPGYNPPPTVQNPSAWQQALAATPGASAQSVGGLTNMATDTGANAYTGNAWQDYQNPSDNASWNYTTDPLFDSSKNVKRWDLAQTGPQSEDDRAKAYRLAFDYLKQKYQIASPGQATQQQMDEALLYGIQRVKTDLSAPENAALGGWQSSPWYGYDKYLTGGQGGTTTNQGGGLAGAASNGTQAGQAASNSAAQGQGQSGGAAGQQAGGNASAALTGQSNSGNSQGGSGGNGTFGQMTGFDPTFAFNAAQQDPAVAAHYLRLANGQSGPVTTRLGQFRDSLYGRALQTYLNLNGVGAGDGSGQQDMQGFLQAMNSGNIGAFLNAAAARVGNADYTGQQDTDVEKSLRAGLALRSMSMGSLGGTLASNDLNNMLYGQEGAGLASNGNDLTGLGSRLRSDQYGQALQTYLNSGR